MNTSFEPLSAIMTPQFTLISADKMLGVPI